MTKLSFPNKTEKALYFSMRFLSWLYMENTMYRTIVRKQDYWHVFHLLQYAFIALAAAAVVYLFAARRPGFGTWPEKKRWLKGFCSYEQLYILYVFFWYIVCVIMRDIFVGGSWFKSNDPWMFITGVMAFLMVPMARYTSFHDTRKTIELLLHPIIIPFALFTAYNLWRYFSGNMLIFPSGHHVFFENRFTISYSNMHRNFLGRQNMVMLAFSLYMLLTQKPALKVVYALCFPVFFFCLILTNSRTSWYTAALILVCAAFFLCWNALDNKKAVLRLAVGLLAAALVVAACHWLRGETFVWLDRAQTRVGYVDPLPADPAPAAQAAAASRARPVYTLQSLSHTEARPDEAPTPALLSEEQQASAASQARPFYDNISTIGNRLPLYRAAFQAMFSRKYQFLFGVTPMAVEACLKQYDGVLKDFNYGHAHNFFLQMGVAYGFPTMLATIAFAVSLLIRGVRLFFINRKKLFPGAWMIPLMTLAFLASDMLEAGLNSDNDIFCASFYLLAGWTVLLDQQSRDPKKKSQ